MYVNSYEVMTMAFDGLMTTASTAFLKEELTAGRINKIYQLSKYEILMQVRAGGKNKKLLLSTHPTYARVQITHLSYQYPDAPPTFCMFLRKHLEGGLIINVEQINHDRIIKFTIRHLNELGDQMVKFLYIEIMGKHSNLIITDTTHRILETIKHISPLVNRYRTLQPGATYVLPPTQEKSDPYDTDFDSFTALISEQEPYAKQLVSKFRGFSMLLAKEIVYRSLSEQIQDLYDAFIKVLAEIQSAPTPHVMLGEKEAFYLIPLWHLEGEAIPQEHLPAMFDRYYFGKEERDRIKQHFADVDRFIHQEYEKNIKKREKLQVDLLKTEAADEYKVLGELILANLYQLDSGQSFARVQNFYSAELEEIDIPLDPRFSVTDNAKKYFQKYQKAKKAVNHILEQLKQTAMEIDYFETLLTQLETATTKDAYEIKEELELAGYLRRRQSKKRQLAGKPNIEKYLSPDGVELYIGKNNLQNDYLTHKFARRHEWWFHAKEMPGSHVLVRSDADSLSEDTIRAAAQLAAYFSKGRLSSSVPVDYTRVRHVKKVPATHLGFVTYDHQKTIYIDPDEAFIMSLEKGK